MTLSDFQHPDIVYGPDARIVFEAPAVSGITLVVVSLARRRLLPLRVHATRRDHSQIWNSRHLIWECSHDRGDGRLCGYDPGHEELPPLAGQSCYSCGQLRAEEVPIAVQVRKGETYP